MLLGMLVWQRLTTSTNVGLACGPGSVFCKACMKRVCDKLENTVSSVAINDRTKRGGMGTRTWGRFAGGARKRAWLVGGFGWNSGVTDENSLWGYGPVDLGAFAWDQRSQEYIDQS